MGVLGVLVQIPADAAPCWKRGSHPCWNEGLLRATAVKAGGHIKCHWIICEDMHVAHVCMQFSMFSFTHMHAVLVPVLSVCYCGYRSDCSHHGSPCSKHQTQADR